MKIPKIHRGIAVLSFIFSQLFAIAQQPAKTDDATHLMGEWFCGANQNDIYQIKSDKTTQHFGDKGTWLLSNNLLTISWENGYRLTIDTTQTGTPITGNSYPPGRNQPDILNFTHKGSTGTVTPTGPTLPITHTLTSADGRKMEVTILSKSETAIKAKRADGKECEIALDKLSAADKAFVAMSKNFDSIPFDGNTINYGRHIIIRVKNDIFAIETKGIPRTNPIKGDRCIYAIEYTIRSISKIGTAKKIISGVADENAKNPQPPIKCKFFTLLWSAGGDAAGCIYIKGQPDDMLPSGLEYYSEQFATIENINSQIDPNKWVRVTK